PELGARRRFYDWLFDGPVWAHMRAGHPALAEHSLQDRLHTPDTTPPRRVTLIDATHVDPARLTLGALRALHEADVIACEDDRAERLMRLARRDAERHRLSDGDLRCPAALAHALLHLGNEHTGIALLKTSSTPHAAWLTQALTKLGDAGMACRITA